MRAGIAPRRTATSNCSSSSATTISSSSFLEPLHADPAHAGLFLDFDGTLADIVARPELARPAAGAREALTALADRFALVAVVSGRPTVEVRELVGVEGVVAIGSYGLDESVAAVPGEALALVAEEAVAGVIGAWVEVKATSVAVHYRQAPDAAAARVDILSALAVLVGEGSELIEGKMVVEVVPAGASRKGGAIARTTERAGLRAVLFAGDDLPDLEAFDALDDLASRGLATVKVAVRGLETPEELLAAADIVADGPAGLVALLNELA